MRIAFLICIFLFGLGAAQAQTEAQEAQNAAPETPHYDEARAQAQAFFAAGEYSKAAAAQAKLAAAIEKDEHGKAGRPGPGTASVLLTLSWYRLFARDFKGSLAASERGMAFAPGWLPLALNKAHALMFLGRNWEARALHLRYKGQPMEKDGKLWEEAVTGDFQEFEKRGLKHAQIEDIKTLLAEKQPPARPSRRRGYW